MLIDEKGPTHMGQARNALFYDFRSQGNNIFYRYILFIHIFILSVGFSKGSIFSVRFSDFVKSRDISRFLTLDSNM